MANLIQIKRSLNSASPTSLANGELAYTANGNVLFIGSNGATVAIGGARNPGVLTANQALVANSTGFIDTIKTANLIFTSLSANGSYGSAGQVLVSDGANVYWGTGTSGSNTQVQFNDSGVANASAGFTFNKSSNTLAVSNTITAVNILATTVNAASHTVGSNVVANTTGVFTDGTVNATALTVGSWVIANNSGVFTSGVVNGDIIRVGTAFVANTTKVVVGSSVGLQANGGVGTAGQVLHSDGTSIYWANTVADLTEVVAGSGLTGGGDTGSVTLNVGQGNGIEVTADTINVLANNGLTANATGVFVVGGVGVTVNSNGVNIGQAVATTSNVTFNDLTITGNTALGSNSSDVVAINGLVNTDVIPSANVTYALGNTTNRWEEVYTGNVHSVDGYFTGDVEVGGDLFITGNLVTTNVQSVVISDPLIYLAGNNYASDLVDIGFAGNYNTSGTNKHTGLFRRAADDTYYLFKGLTQELDSVSVVNVADPTFAIADLKAYLISGGLISNATNIAITANSTVEVALVANTLTLGVPLAATSGGTGFNTYTAGDIITASNSTSLSKLSLGTDGYVLQSNGSALVYNTLDGGTF